MWRVADGTTSILTFLSESDAEHFHECVMLKSGGGEKKIEGYEECIFNYLHRP